MERERECLLQSLNDHSVRNIRLIIKQRLMVKQGKKNYKKKQIKEVENIPDLANHTTPDHIKNKA